MTETGTEKSGAGSDTLELSIKCTSSPDFTVSINKDATVKDLKDLIAEQHDVPADKQRLIFSGRMMKDAMTLKEFNIQTGNTLHLIKRAAAKQAQTQANPASVPSPSQLSAGQETGNPLSDLTGARYSGLANLPPASIFGPDGGLGPSPGMDQVEEILNNPEQLSEVLNQVAHIDENDPLLRMLPQEARQQFLSFSRDPIFQSMIADPDGMRILRNVMSASLQMENSGAANGLRDDRALASLLGNGSHAPDISTSEEGSDANASSGSSAAAGAASSSDEVRRLQDLLGLPVPGTQTGMQQRLSEMFAEAGMFPPAQNGTAQRGGDISSPMLENILARAFANSAPPTDTSRPPEEVYEMQLRQLNELGFFDFDRNVKALRRSGGNIEGAIEALVENLV